MDLLAAFLVLSLGPIFGLFPLIHGGSSHPGSVAEGLLTMPIIFIEVPLSFVFANMISWQIPSVRRAN
jgi:hypothetical protein